ncbi:alpha/beta hydrolase, partial [Devosia sp.]|uniref:alpha/beta hydrolase n=1 Tax=Devosia sp. TaxID=1871048 RepID=UPI002F2240B2
MDEHGYAYAEHTGAGAGAPVLFLFHGTGGDEHQFLDLGAELRPDARLVAPRGDVSEGGALRYFRRLAEGRYDMDDLDRATAKMAAFVGERLAGNRPAEVAGFGYSNGANILASVLLAHPGLFDAAVLLHPLIPFEPAPQPGLAGRRILITAGRRDPICPPPATEALAGYFRRQGA